MVEPQSSRFWQDVLRLRIVEESELREAWNAIGPEKRTADAIDRRLARQLIQTGRLTMWQAQQIYSVRNPLLRIDQYVLLDTVGKGGMGRVYRARDTKLGRIVAIKTMTAERMANERAISRFQREILASAQLEHESLVRIYDGGRSNEGLMYLAMEFIEGKSAGSVIQDQGRMDPALAVRLCREVALGLEHARSKGLIHRDVHPWNILITERGTAKLTDLGLAISQNHLLEGAASVTRDGVTVGNFDYLSPEQAKDSHNVDTRADIYSLGCTLYHMISGRAPFLEESLSAKLIAHQEQEPAPLESLAPGLPSGLTSVIRKMMAKAREDRYATPAEVAQALAPFTEDRLYASNAVAAPAVSNALTAPTPTHTPVVPASLQAQLEPELSSDSGSGSSFKELSPVSLSDKENGPKRPSSPPLSNIPPSSAAPLFSIRTDEDDAPPRPVAPAKPKAAAPAPAPSPPPAAKPMPAPAPSPPPPAPPAPTPDNPFGLRFDDPPASQAPPAKAKPAKAVQAAKPVAVEAAEPSEFEEKKPSPLADKLKDPGIWLAIGSGAIFLLIGCALVYIFVFQNRGGSKTRPQLAAETSAKKPAATAKTKPQPKPKAETETETEANKKGMAVAKTDGKSETPLSETAASKDEPADAKAVMAKSNEPAPAPEAKAEPAPPPTPPAPAGPKLVMTRLGRRFNPIDFKDALERIANNRSEILLPPQYEYEVASQVEGIINDARVTIRPVKRGDRAILKLKMSDKPLLQCGSGCEIAFQDIDFQIEPADSAAPLMEYLDNNPAEFTNCTFAGRKQETLLRKK